MAKKKKELTDIQYIRNFLLISSFVLFVLLIILNFTVDLDKHALRMEVPAELTVEKRTRYLYDLYHGASYEYQSRCEDSSNSEPRMFFNDITLQVEFIPGEFLEEFDPINPDMSKEYSKYSIYTKSVYEETSDTIYSTNLGGHIFKTYEIGSEGCTTFLYFLKIEDEGVLVVTEDKIEELDGFGGELNMDEEQNTFDEFRNIEGVIADKKARDQIKMRALESIVIERGNDIVFEF